MLAIPLINNYFISLRLSIAIFTNNVPTIAVRTYEESRSVYLSPAAPNRTAVAITANIETTALSSHRTKNTSSYDDAFFPADIVPHSQQRDQSCAFSESTASRPPRMMTSADLQTFSEMLPAKVQKALNDDLTGKPNPNVSFHAQLVL